MKYFLIAIFLISNSIFLASCERVKDDIRKESPKQESKIEGKKPVVTPVVTKDIPTSKVNGLPSFAELIKKLKPAVVNISTTNKIKRRSTPFSSPFEEGYPFGDYFKKFFDSPEREFKQKGKTAVPTALVMKSNKIKLEFALVRGRKDYEKKHVAKEKQLIRDLAKDAKER